MQSGLGIIGKVAFAYSGVQFLSIINSSFPNTKFTMGVGNDVDQNSLVDYNINVNLTSSLIEYSQ